MAIMAPSAFIIAMVLASGCATTHHTISPTAAPATRPASTSPCDAPPAAQKKDPASDYLDIETCPVSPSPEKAKPHRAKDPPKGAMLTSRP